MPSPPGEASRDTAHDCRSTENLNCRVVSAGMLSGLPNAHPSFRTRWLAALALLLLVTNVAHALPRRLVLLVDGVSYRDVAALQQGVTYTDSLGRQFTRRAFHEGYFPVSRLVSTYPSASDVAWTEILGNRPLPGYQRTYFCAATHAEIYLNGISTTMEYERQMHWQLDGGVARAFGYLHPHTTFKREVREAIDGLLRANVPGDTFYALIRASDDAQHTKGDIMVLLDFLHDELQQLAATYRARAGRELEILLLSDHGNNRAGAGNRVDFAAFLQPHGYRVSDRIETDRDVVLPTVGIQNWVEIQCATNQITALTSLLATMPGVDVLTAQPPGHAGAVTLINSTGERALIEGSTDLRRFRYTPVLGDPLGYAPVLETLRAHEQIDADGFTSANAWEQATFAHRYPLAPERILRGHTRLALNPAPILIALQNGYVHSSWTLKQLTGLMRMGGTHGGLDDLCSNGILLSNFLPTRDASATRVATFFGGFPGLKDPRSDSQGAEWTYHSVQALTAIARSCVDHQQPALPRNHPLLRVWAAAFRDLPADMPVEISLRETPAYSSPHLRRGDALPSERVHHQLELLHPFLLPDPCSIERLYVAPGSLQLLPGKTYRITGRVRDGRRVQKLFTFDFPVDSHGRPVLR